MVEWFLTLDREQNKNVTFFVVPGLSSFTVYKMKQTHQQMFTCVLLCEPVHEISNNVAF